MKEERPIILKEPMIRAILDGRKTQLRIPVKSGLKGWKRDYHQKGIHSALSAYPDGSGNGYVFNSNPPSPKGAEWTAKHYPDNDGINCQLGKVGDMIWVKETLRKGSEIGGRPKIVYKSTETGMGYHEGCPEGICGAVPWMWGERKTLPSTQMPRWASRIELEIVGLRVERLNSISESDAIAEGLTEYFWSEPCTSYPHIKKDIENGMRWWEHVRKRKGRSGIWDDAVKAFREWWEDEHGKGSWKENPWVWCIDLRRVRRLPPKEEVKVIHMSSYERESLRKAILEKHRRER